MNVRPLILPAVAAAIAAALAAHASNPLEERFKEFDKNGDGILSGEELDAAPYLRSMDQDGDGKVTAEEARQALGKLGRKALQFFRDRSGARSPELLGPRTEDIFRELDRNRDGQLTSNELKDAQYFKKLDKNGDGTITLEEAVAVIGERLPAREFFKDNPIPIQPPVEWQEGPQTVRASERGVGHLAPAVRLEKLDGGTQALAPAPGGKALVLGLFSPTCPISGKLGPELARLEKDYRDQGVSFAWLAASPSSNPDAIRRFISDHHLAGTVAHDTAGAVARALQAETTTEVFVLDAARTLVYRGAINDQYGLGYALDQPRHSYLRDALDAILRDETPAIAATTAPGCALDLPRTPAPAVATSAATYHRDIARIMNQNCVECHRAGGLGPFTLTSYDDVIEHAGMIRKQIDRGAMPPWFASPSESGAHAVFSNDRSLAEADKTSLLAWLNSDRPKGDLADAPLPRKFAEGWLMGEPDLVVQLPRPVAVKAEGTMPYENITVPLDLAEDRWVQAYEIVPTDRSVVHHVIVRVIDKSGRTARDDGNETDGLWAAYVPGNSTRILPEGFAKRLPAGARLHFQIHYTPTGKTTEDQLKIGLRFAAKPPQYVVYVTGLPNAGIVIPPHDANHVETLTRMLPADMLVSSLMPHMHVRGKAFKFELVTADGKTETLLDVPRYDFNWQLPYRFAQPRLLPRGSSIRLTAVYDNSSANRANPDPDKTVRWGQQTSDEMMIGYVEHFVPNRGAHMAATK